LRILDQKPNPPTAQFQNNLHAISTANPTLIKTRCASVITKAHHPSSLTEEDDAPQRHKDTKKRRISNVQRSALLSVSLCLCGSPRNFCRTNPPQPAPSASLASWRSAFPPHNAKCAERTHVPFCLTYAKAPQTVPKRPFI